MSDPVIEKAYTDACTEARRNYEEVHWTIERRDAALRDADIARWAAYGDKSDLTD